jgi:hypothetical protein
MPTTLLPMKTEAEVPPKASHPVPKYQGAFPDYRHNCDVKTEQTPWLLVRKRTIPTERPPLVSTFHTK